MNVPHLSGSTYGYGADTSWNEPSGNGPWPTKDRVYYYLNDGTSNEGDAGYSAIVYWTP